MATAPRQRQGQSNPLAKAGRVCPAALLLLALAAPGAHGEEEGEAAASDLPQFQALRSDPVHLRVGPGTQYPIDWVYQRRDMPMLVLGRQEQWRLVQDWEGEQGWVRQDLLSGRRSLIVIGGIAVLRVEPQPGAAPVARAEPGVIGRVSSCAGDWCRVSIEGHQGWLPRDTFWGWGSSVDASADQGPQTPGD